MATMDSSEPLAGAMLSQRESPLAMGLFEQAQGIYARFEGFGVAGETPTDTLLDALIGRWSLPERLENGLELFDLDALGELSHGWSVRDGYFDTRFDFDGPFVVPVDPDVPAPIDGGYVRRSRRRRPPGALRPAAPRSTGQRSTRSSAAEVSEAIADRWTVEPAAADFASPPLDAALIEPTEARLEAGQPPQSSAERAAPRDASGARPVTEQGSPMAPPAPEARSTAAPASALPAVRPADETPRPSPTALPVDAAPRDRSTAPTPPAPGRMPTASAAPASGHAPRPMSTLARQRWRASGERSLTPYPRAMGSAGAVDASLLRFPEARARLGGLRPAILAGPPSVDLIADGHGVAPASRGAERLVQRLFDHLAPVAEPVSAWLVPWVDGDAPPMLGSVVSPVGAADAGDRARRRPSALADRAPSAELVTPDPVRPPVDVSPARSTAIGRRRPDGRLPLTARTTPRLMAPTAVISPAAEPTPPDAVGTANAGLSRPTGAAPTADLPRADAPDIAADRALPAAARAALAAERRIRPEPTIGASGAPTGRAAPLSGARAWLREALDARPIVTGPAPHPAPASDGMAASMDGAAPRPAAAARAPHALVPGATGAAARLMAERLAVAAGEPALLARLPDADPLRSVMSESGVMASAAFVEALAPEAAAPPAAAPPTAAPGLDPQRTPVLSPTAESGRPAATASTAASGSDTGAPTAHPVDVEAVDARQPDVAASPETPLVADAPELPGAASGAAPSAPAPASDPANWAERIAQRLGVDRPDAPGLAAVVDRITERLTGGGTLLAERLDRFAAAERPEERERAWRAVIDEAGLDPSAAALVEPVADRVLGPAEPPAVDRRSPTPRVTTTPAASIEPATSAPTLQPRTDAPAAPAASRAAASTRPTPTGIQRAAARARTTGPASVQSASATRPAIGRRPSLAARPGTFERRMGVSSAARPVAPAEARRWVIDPAGRRWLVPIAGASAAIGASSPASVSGARSPSARSAGEVDSVGSTDVGLIEVGLSPTAELAERIASALMPDGRPTGAFAASTTRLLTRLAPAQADAWIASGFDPLTLPPTERALVEAAAPVRAAHSDAAASTSPASGSTTAAAPFTERVRSQAKALARPGALGSAMARLAGRVAERPAMAVRTPAERSVVVPEDASVDSPSAGRARSGRTAGAASDASGTSTRPASRLPSAMDPAALVAAGSTAAESRMPARLRQWAAIGDAPARVSVPGDYGSPAPGVMIAPGGPSEAAVGDVVTGSTASGGGATASLPGARTTASALRAFDRARVANGSKAAAVGRPMPSATDVGQLVAAAMLSGPPGGRLFGDRGPLAVEPPSPAGRVYIETGKRASGDQPLRSTGESAGPRAETNDNARHRLSNQTEGDLSPEEQERLADEVIARLRRELEFEGSRFGGDEWD